MRRAVLSLLFLLVTLPLGAAETLDVYFVDVEGGQATLLVSPSGESMLVDAGWPGFGGRDADRIVATAKAAGVKRLDYLLVTHYHQDHVGGVPAVAAKIPIGHFVDHGPNVEITKELNELFAAYCQVRDKGQHLVVKPRDKIPIKGLEVEVVAAAGQMLSVSLEGGGGANRLCAGTARRAVDPTENAQSVATLIRFGKFRLANLADLTWNKELDLVCPFNRLGTVDVYLTTHHGMNLSGSAAIVHALAPRVAIMNNGARKGGSPEAWQTIRSSPGLEDIWQLHYAVEAGSQNNAAAQFIANPEEKCKGYGLKLSAQADGSFTVTNMRTGFAKRYAPR